jgi:hypothetical protein
VLQGDLGHRETGADGSSTGCDGLDLGQRGRGDCLGGVELLDVGERGDLQEMAVLLGGETLGAQLKSDGVEHCVVGAVAGGEVQTPLPHVEAVGDRGQGDPGEVGDELLELVALPVGDLAGEQDDLGGPGVGC